jgi:hypothetical protein
VNKDEEEVVATEVEGLVEEEVNIWVAVESQELFAGLGISKTKKNNVNKFKENSKNS